MIYSGARTVGSMLAAISQAKHINKIAGAMGASTIKLTGRNVATWDERPDRILLCIK
jgi:hypothetical protein